MSNGFRITTLPTHIVQSHSILKQKHLKAACSVSRSGPRFRSRLADRANWRQGRKYWRTSQRRFTQPALPFNLLIPLLQTNHLTRPRTTDIPTPSLLPRTTNPVCIVHPSTTTNPIRVMCSRRTTDSADIRFSDWTTYTVLIMLTD
jgi:hypothetical protein